MQKDIIAQVRRKRDNQNVVTIPIKSGIVVDDFVKITKVKFSEEVD